MSLNVPIKDDMADTIENVLESGNPLLLLGVKCIGKKTKFMEYCHKHDYEFRIYNAFQVDQDFVGSAIDREFSETEFADVLKNALEPPYYPEILTETLNHYEPYDYVVEDMKSCIKSGKTTVLAFLSNNPGRSMTNMASVAIAEMIVNCRVAGIEFAKDKLKIAIISDIPLNDNSFQPFRQTVMRLFKSYRKTNYDRNDVRLAVDYMEKNGYHDILTDFFKTIRPEKFIECMKSAYKDSLAQNSADLKSIRTLSDFLLQDNSKEIKSPLLTLNDNLKEEYYKKGARDFDTAFKMMEEIEKNISDWVLRTSIKKYPGDDSPNSLKKAVNTFLNEVVPEMKKSNMKLNQRMGGEAHKIFQIAINMMNNFLRLSDNVASYRKKVLATYVDKEFAEVFAEFYNYESDKKMRQAKT